MEPSNVRKEGTEISDVNKGVTEAEYTGATQDQRTEARMTVETHPGLAPQGWTMRARRRADPHSKTTKLLAH